MEQVDPRDLQAILDRLTGLEGVKPAKFKCALFEVEFHPETPSPEPVSTDVRGFNAGAPPPKAEDNGPGAMHRRAFGGFSLPELNPAPPTSSGSKKED